PLRKSQIIMAPSSPQLASRVPSGLTLRNRIVPLCASSILTHSAVLTSHQRSIPRLSPLINWSPLGVQASVWTIPKPTANVCTHAHLGTSHTNNSPLSPLPPQLPSSLPSGFHLTSLTQP